MRTTASEVGFWNGGALLVRVGHGVAFGHCGVFYRERSGDTASARYTINTVPNGVDGMEHCLHF